MNFHSNVTVLEKLTENLEYDIITEIKFLMIEEDKKTENKNQQKKDAQDVNEISDVLQIKVSQSSKDTDKTKNKEPADNKDKTIDGDNQKKDESNEEQMQTTNDNKQENDLEVRIKWLSRQYDELYNKLYSLVKNKPSVNDLFTKFTDLYALLEFFLQNIAKYTDEEKTRIYTNFKLAIKNINNELKQMM